MKYGKEIQELNIKFIDALLGAWMVECLKQGDPEEYQSLLSYFYETDFYKNQSMPTFESLYSYLEYKQKNDV